MLNKSLYGGLVSKPVDASDLMFNTVLEVCSSEFGFRFFFFFQAKKKELARRDDIEDGDSMISSATSDTGSSKRKRCALL